MNKKGIARGDILICEDLSTRQHAARRALIVSIAAGIVFPFGKATYGQAQPARVYRVGFLHSGRAPGGPRQVLNVLRSSLRKLNYVEGQNLIIEARFAEGDYRRLPELAAELVDAKVDVIVSSGTPATRAAKEATAVLPIVMMNTGDAVASGLVAGLARPGGNVTGTTIVSPELAAKRLELLKEAFPQIRRVAVLLNPVNSAQVHSWRAIESRGKALSVEVLKFEPQGAAGLEKSFAAMTSEAVDGLVLPVDAMLNRNAPTIVALAATHRLPAIGPVGTFTRTGILMSYGVLRSEMDARPAYFVDRILKGAKPVDLPVERPTRFDFVVNLKTAQALGVSLPDSILVRANRLIR